MRQLLESKTGPAPPAPKSRKRWKRRMLRFAVAGPFLVCLLTILVVLPWRWVSPPTTAFIVRERWASAEPVRYRWVDWDDISTELAIAAVASEDQKFPRHRGFDWDAIGDALESNRAGGRVRGASTISQQVAKNMFLWPGQSWIRKGAEAYLTVWIELLWPKRRILEIYLNVAEFGPGVFGAGEASRRLMGKSPAALTGYDAAILAAVLPSPKRMSASSPSDYVRGRARQIQSAVDRLGGTAYLSGL